MLSAARRRRVIALIASLYPRAWRERYGEEFAALLEESEPTAGAAFNVFTGGIAMQLRGWNLGKIFAISAAVAAAAFAAEYYFVPVRYVSSGVFKMVGTGEITPADLDSFNTTVEFLESRRTLTREITGRNMYLHERARMPVEDLIDLMRRRIKVEPTGLAGGGKGLLVSFMDDDPKLAQTVTADLISGFMDQSAQTVALVDPASMPDQPTRRRSLLAYTALLPGALVLAVLMVLRRRALKKA